jgi:hypothetical protein
MQNMKKNTGNPDNSGNLVTEGRFPNHFGGWDIHPKLAETNFEFAFSYRGAHPFVFQSGLVLAFPWP